MACGAPALAPLALAAPIFTPVLEEYIPHRLNGNGKRTFAVSETPATAGTAEV